MELQIHQKRRLVKLAQLVPRKLQIRTKLSTKHGNADRSDDIDIFDPLFQHMQIINQNHTTRTYCYYHQCSQAKRRRSEIQIQGQSEGEVKPGFTDGQGFTVTFMVLLLLFFFPFLILLVIVARKLLFDFI